MLAEPKYYIELAGVLPKDVICFSIFNDEKDCCGFITCSSTNGKVSVTHHPDSSFAEETETKLIKMVKDFWKNTYSNSKSN